MSKTISAERASMQAQTKNWKRISIKLAIIIGVIVGLYVLLDLPYRLRFATVYNEVEKVRHDVIVPAGGVDIYSPQVRGNGWFDTLGCIDTSCPDVSRTWLIPIPIGQEDQFVHNLMTTEGYGQKTGGIGIKNDLQLDIWITTVVSKIHTPYSAPTGKEWRFVQVDASYH